MLYNFKPEGPRDARLAVVCEKPARDECLAGRLLVGPSGMRVRGHLKKAGLDAGDVHNLSKEVWLTNAVQSFDSIGNPSDEDIIRELPRLYRELSNLPNLVCIVGMGAPALKALTNFRYTEISKYRGSRLFTAFGVKLVPTFHPAFYMRGEWRFAPIVQFDVRRAKGELEWLEIRHKYQRRLNIRPDSLQTALAWTQHLRTSALESGYLSFDIETVPKDPRNRNKTSWFIDCIAFSTDPTEAYCIPLMQRDRKPYWPNISDERLIWQEISSVLNLPGVRYVTQNGCAFDDPQLRKHGVKLDYMASGFDTLSAHSLIAPDLPHDLGFLVSLYTDEEYYKDETGQTGYGQEAEDERWRYNCKDAACTLEVAMGEMGDLREL